MTPWGSDNSFDILRSLLLSGSLASGDVQAVVIQGVGRLRAQATKELPARPIKQASAETMPAE